MTEHYFSERPGAADRPTTVSFSAHGRSFELASSTGVFSGERLDPGTTVLLRTAPLPPAGSTVLDLGCGYGPIACVLAGCVPDSMVWAVDVNTRALELCRMNAGRLADAGDSAGTIVAARPEEVPDELAFDQIWSNPPIRIGKDALHELLERWLPRLTPDGVATLVVGKNLGSDSLQRWLTTLGWRADRLASSKGFRVLTVRR